MLSTTVTLPTHARRPARDADAVVEMKGGLLLD